MPATGPFVLLLGVILYAGVIGSYLFERYRVPDVLNLIAIGLLLGPVLRLIEPARLTPWMPVVGALALGLILFEGGLDLDFDQVVARFGPAVLTATLSFFLAGAGIAVAYRLIAGEPWRACALLGAVLGCVSSAVILPVVSGLRVPDSVRASANLEAALSDMWGVVLTLVFLRLPFESGYEVGHALHSVLRSFTVAVAGGAVFGFVWLWALDRLRRSPFSYMMTLAAVFVLYGLTEIVHGSGPMAVLTFGVFLTNADKAAALFGKEFRFVLDERIRSFNTELTFFARTFFFVYLGLVVTLHDLDRVVLRVAGAAFLVVLASRAAAISVLRRADPASAGHAPLLAALVPRGLTTAVLAGLVWESGLPGGARFLVLAFALILLTNLYMTWRLFVLERAAAAAG